VLVDLSHSLDNVKLVFLGNVEIGDFSIVKDVVDVFNEGLHDDLGI